VPLLNEPSRRRRNLLIISAFLVLLALASAVNFEMRVPQLPLASNIVVFALFNLNLIVFLLLLVLLFKNLIKLWFERRQKLIGARFKTKLVVAFLSLSLAPALLIFLIASNFINKSIEGWFKPQVERPLDQALAVAQTYYQNLQAAALRHGQHIARVIDRDGLLAEPQREALVAYLVEQQEQLGLSALTVFNGGGQELVHVKDPALGDLPTRDVNESQLKLGLVGQHVTTVRELPSGDLIEAITPIVEREPERRILGAVVVGTHVTERLEQRIRGIEQAFQEYKQLKLVKNPIKGIYILLFLLMTLIVVFSFSWFGLYLARGITGPIAELAEATREVAAGNLAYKVQTRADDEIGVLVDSFNRMTDDLGRSKGQLEEAYLDLQDKHTELEERRRYTETVLEAVTTGVLSLDPQSRLTTLNRAAAAMFGLQSADAVGRRVEEVFGSSDLREVVGLVQRVRRIKAGAVEQELHLRRRGATVSLLASATALRGPDGEYAGAVIVFDDLTELLKAQRLAAWREVAQRIAHEIKNPLTPIQLSAQRLRRRLGRSAGDEQLVTECTATIIQEVDGLRRLVDEFSRFARMPVLTPRPTDLRAIVEAVVSLYRESHPRLRLSTRYPDDLPLAEVDPDHIKRAVLNLVDNAVEAVVGVGDVEVEIVHLADAGRVQVVVSDSGTGINPEDKDKLFLPYFSTKTNGMGLGLPIVHEIVTEHGGIILVEDNQPRGSRFVMELPVARVGAPVETSR
jgi:two-component system, NtrC family, nitrogen regulation sensor histidine kinase NtrY